VIPTQSSTALDAEPEGRDLVVGSIEQRTRNLGILPLSEGVTVTTTLARPEAFDAALKGYFSDAGGGVTWRYFRRPGWVTFQSPTLRLTAGASEPTQFSAPKGDWWSMCERTFAFSELPVTTWFQVTGAGAAQPIKPVSGFFNSTDTVLGISRLVASQFEDAAAAAQQEWFEDGRESQFSRTLSTLLHTWGDAVVSTVEGFLGSRTANTEVAVEAAQWLGAVDHPPTYRYRKTLLETLLTSPSTRLRHGAASGLAAMNDPSSLSVVREATDGESNGRLRRFLELVVDQLERTRACRSS